MEKLKIDSFGRALTSLEEILKEKENTIVRDATIQRFEYTFEAMWKALKFYLLNAEGQNCNSPKQCIRTAGKVGILTAEETETALKLVDDRNMTTHTYIEAVAIEIFEKIPDYCKIMKKIYNKINE
jgi:nucleotidyltransferase substrate binding protein (TIGR01987 family)